MCASGPSCTCVLKRRAAWTMPMVGCLQVSVCSNAFVSQVGRTARQGMSGKVTSLYSPDRQHLAEAVKNAIEADEPIEGAFSRNRSFAKKFRKYGQYVPRGQTLAV